MKPLGFSANALAHALRAPPNRVAAVANGTRAVTADSALRLARYFGNSEQSWLTNPLGNRKRSRSQQGRGGGAEGPLGIAACPDRAVR